MISETADVLKKESEVSETGFWIPSNAITLERVIGKLDPSFEQTTSLPMTL